jgi:simple sugar transport system ATP-binding protein
VLRRLRDNGATIVLITHRLDEVVELSDTITVMRAGQTVARIKTSETTPAEIAHAMVGREVSLSAGKRVEPIARPSTAPTDRGLEIRNLYVTGSRGVRVVDDVSFSIQPGEILGIAGVEGNGQTELIEALAGLRPVAGGEILVAGTDVARHTVSARHDAGLSHIPEDRHRRDTPSRRDTTLASRIFLKTDIAAGSSSSTLSPIISSSAFRNISAEKECSIRIA